MYSGIKVKKTNPKTSANFLSKLFYIWIVPLFYRGKHELQLEDFYQVLSEDKSSNIGDRLDYFWEKELNNSKLNDKTPNLYKVLFQAFGFQYMFWGLTMFLRLMINTIPPLILSHFISLFTKTETLNENDLYINGTLLVVMIFIVILLVHHGNFEMSLIGMRCRVALSSLVYRKILKMNQTTIEKITTGHVVNLLSNDLSRFDTVAVVLHALWIIPFLIPLVTYFLWQAVQESSIAGIFCIATLSIPLQGYLGKLSGNLRLKIARKSDKRIKIISEIISGIQTIKMYAWEVAFEKLVRQARSSEISDIKTTSYYRGFYASFSIFLQSTSLFVTIAVFVLLGNEITPETIFSVACYFNSLNVVLSIYYPRAVSLGGEAITSVKRLRDFLSLEEREAVPVGALNHPGVYIDGVFASWVPGVRTLEDVSLRIPNGILCVIVGPVGAGKSSLLQLLLRELPPTSGKLSIGGQISYASQQPWLFAASVRDNILFGQEYDKHRYQKVLKLCALQEDLEQFVHGDKTLVGDRGVSLSGGQKSRINLARAIYRQADIYILDDPLSAVDTRVGRYLLEECICKHLKDKTRILVTHQLRAVKKADLIVVMEKGHIEVTGSYDELLKNNVEFIKTTEFRGETIKDRVHDEDNRKVARELSCSLGKSLDLESLDFSQQQQFDENTKSIASMSTLKEYFQAAGNWCLLFILFLLVISSQSFSTFGDYWVAYWTLIEEKRRTQQTNSSEISSTSNSTTIINSLNQTEDGIICELPNEYTMLSIYAGTIALTIVLTLTRSFVFYKTAMMSSEKLHQRMFRCVLQTPMKFFNTNLSGRIINRFSQDMGAVDELLPRVLIESTQMNLIVCGILINVFISNHYAAVPILICGILYWIMRNWNITLSRNIKHIEASTKSLVFSHVGSTVNGVATIRAANADSILISEFDALQDNHTSTWYLTMLCLECFGLWFDILCVIFMACVTYSFIVLQYFSPIEGSLVGLALSKSMMMIGFLEQTTRQTAETYKELTSVERVLEYTTLETEGPFETTEGKLSDQNWPTSGRTEFKKLSLRYSESGPSVLMNLTFCIYEGEKIGIVGRTGAGKSSIISALCRLATLEGSIFIDEVDIKTIGLTDLRKNISVIPQDPVLFSSTLRYNLDPFEEFEDVQLWQALEEVELKDVVPSLNFLLNEGGNNFSLGQRQLICLARALLRKNRIIVLDEATANVDMRTDELIQTTIREKFRDSTVLTIAHRLNTIMDSDRVLVLSSGAIVEFDHPHILLNYEDGYFASMVQKTDPETILKLRQIAYKAFNMKMKK